MITELHPRYHLRKVRYTEKITKEEAVIEAVLRSFQITIYQFEVKSRKRDNCVWPRQVAHYMLHKYTTMSLSQIGLAIGNKNHATVLHSCKVIDNEIKLASIYHTSLYKRLQRAESEYKRLVR